MLRGGAQEQSKHDQLMEGLSSLIAAFRNDDDSARQGSLAQGSEVPQASRRQKQRQKDDVRVMEDVSALEQLVREVRTNCDL